MKKKKGFTLIELIVTIGLICVLGAIIVTNMASNLTDKQDEQYENFKKTLENAACMYLELSKDKANLTKDMKSFKATCKTAGCSVDIKSLLENGLLEESDLKSPREEELIPTNKVVQITYSSGVKTCTFIE